MFVIPMYFYTLCTLTSNLYILAQECLFQSLLEPSILHHTMIFCSKLPLSDIL